MVERLEYERSSQSWYVNCMKLICNNKVKPYQIPLIIMLLDGKESDPNPVCDMPVCMSTTVVMFKKSLILRNAYQLQLAKETDGARLGWVIFFLLHNSEDLFVLYLYCISIGCV